MSTDLPEKYIPVDEIIRRAKKHGIPLGRGNPYHTLRYYTKISLLPHMRRKLPYPGAESTVGHYPESIIETLKKIAELKRQRFSNEEIKRELEPTPPLVAPEPEAIAAPPSQIPPSFFTLPEALKNISQTFTDLAVFIRNMVRKPYPYREPTRFKLYTHLLTLLLIFITLTILSLGFSDLTRTRVKRWLVDGFWNHFAGQVVSVISPKAGREMKGEILAREILSPIVDVNDVLEYVERAEGTRNETQNHAETWLRPKLPLEVDKLISNTFQVVKSAVLNTTRLLGTIFFGKGDKYYISPLADASFHSVRVEEALEADLVSTDYLIISSSMAVANLNADFLDSLDSSQFLRSDVSDEYTSGTLTFAAGTTLNVNSQILNTTGNLTIADSLSQTGGGQVTFSGNVDANSGLDVAGITVLGDGGISNFAQFSSTGDLSFYGSADTITSESSLLINPTGDLLLTTAGDTIVSTGAFDLNNTGVVTIGTDGLEQNITFETANFDVNSTGTITIDGTDFTYTPTGTYTVDATGAVSIDSDASAAFSGAGIDITSDGANAVTITYAAAGGTFELTDGTTRIEFADDGSAIFGDDGATTWIDGSLITLSGDTVIVGTITEQIPDNTADAFDLEDANSDNYLNINTTDLSEEIQFGNAATNPDYSFLGIGNFAVSTTGDFAAALATNIDLATDNLLAADIDIGTSAQANTISLGSASSGNLTIDSGSTIDLSGAGAGVIGLNTLNGDITIDATAASVIIDGGTAAAGAVTLQATNANAATTLVINSSGTGATALDVDSAGGIEIDADLASNFNTAAGDITIEAETGSVIVKADEGVADAILLDADTTAGSGIVLDAYQAGVNTTGGIDIDAGTGDIDIDLVGAAADFLVNTTATGAVTSGAITLTTDNTEAVGAGVGGDITLQALSTGATATSGNILISSVDREIDLTSTGYANASAIDINAIAGGVDIDATLLIALTSTRDNAQAILLESTAGGLDILASGAAAGEDIDIVATGSSVNISSTEADAQAITIQASAGGVDIDGALQVNIASSQAADGALTLTTSNAAGQIVIDSADTTADGIDVDSAGGFDLLASGAAGGAGDIALHSDNASITLTADEADADAIVLNATAGGVNIDAAAASIIDIAIGAAGTINIADDAVAKTIDIGGVTHSGTDTINIATEGTAADIINIGNASSTLAVDATTTFSIDADFSLASSENVTLTNTSASTDQLALTVSGVTATGVDALSIAFTQADDGDATDINAALQIDVTSSSGDADTLYGINLGNLAAGTASEYALNIGTGWDRDLSFADGSPIIAIADGGTLSITDGTNLLMSIADGGSDGNVIITGDTDLGNAAEDTISFGGVVDTSIVASDNTKNLGSTSTHWATGWIDNVIAINISGVVTGGSTSSPSWTINSLNVTNDAEVSSLAFERGAPEVNAVMQWNVSGGAGYFAGYDKNLLFNFPISIFSQVSATQQTFTSGSLFNYGQDVTHAITQSGAFVGLDVDFSSNITVPNTASGNQTGVLMTLLDGGASATSIGFDLDGTADLGLDLSGAAINTADLRLSNSATIDNSSDGTLAFTEPTVQLVGSTAIDIDSPTIALNTQATDIDIKDDTASALTISQSTDEYLNISTTNTATSLTLDLPVAGSASTTGNLFTAAVNKTVNISDSASTNTIDIGGVTHSGTDTINIATEGTAADAIAIGNTNVSTTLALTGGDDWTMAATGVLTMSASAAQTTAIVITDTDYTNALSIGDNNIIGTTGNIDLTNFDVVGSSGNITTAGDLSLTGTGKQLKLSTDTGDPSALGAGSLYYNTSSTVIRVYNGAAWEDVRGLWVDGGTYIYPSNVGTSYQIANTSGDTTISGDLTVSGTFVSVGTTTLTTNLNADLLDSLSESAFFRLSQNETVTGRPAFNGGVSGSTSPFTVDSTYVVTNLNADMVDGYHYASSWPNPSNMITGSGTSGYVPKFTGTYTIGNSIVQDNGSTVTIGGDLTVSGGDIDFANNWTLSSTSAWPSNYGFTYSGANATFGFSSTGGKVAIQADGDIIAGEGDKIQSGSYYFNNSTFYFGGGTVNGDLSASTLTGNLVCTNCVNATEIEDIYLFNTTDWMNNNGPNAGPTAGTLVFAHPTNYNRNSIVFTSRINYGSDYGYIEFRDDDNDSGEALRLTIGTSNDADDDLVLDPSGRLQIAATNMTLNTSGTATLAGNLTAADLYTSDGITIQGTSGRNYFKDSELSTGNGLRVGAAWAYYGIYAESGDVVVGSATGIIRMQAAGTGTVYAGNYECSGCIDTGEMKTGTSSTSGTGHVNVTMHDYTFFPNLEADDCGGGSNWTVYIWIGNAPNDTIGRFRFGVGCTSGSWDARWRYITASDRPIIWVIANIDGSLTTVWQGEDPVHQFEYPENPNPFEGTKLEEGQRFVNVEPLTISQLQSVYNSLPIDDKTQILDSLRAYLVTKRGWLTQFNNISDLANISDQYRPAARFWAMRFIAEHYDIAPSELILETMEISDNKLVPKGDFYSVLSNHLQQRSLRIEQNKQKEQQLAALPKEIKDADISEWYTPQENIDQPAPGDLISFGSPDAPGLIVKSAEAYDSKLMGVISTAPKETLGNRLTENDVKVSLTGRVPTKVSTINGPIEIGDPITSSEIPGVGMRATRPGPTIGKALEPYDNPDPNAVGEILVFADLGWYDPQVYLTSAGELQIVRSQESGASSQEFKLKDKEGNLITRIGAFAEAVIAHVKAGLVETKELLVEGTAHVAGRLRAEEIISPVIETDLLIAKEAEIETLTAGTIKANKIEGVQFNQVTEVTNVTEVTVISQESGVGSQELEGQEANSPQARFMEVISDKLQVIRGIFEELVVNHVKALALDVAGNLSALSARITDLFARNITVEEKLISPVADFGEVTSDKVQTARLEIRTEGETTGEATIPAGETSILITNYSITNYSRVFVTPQVAVPVPLAVTKLSQEPLASSQESEGLGSFTVEIAEPQEFDVPFHWWVINVVDDKHAD